MNRGKNISKLSNQKVSGFTIQETLIAMVITGLISVLTFSAVRYYHRLFSGILKVGTVQSDINQLQQALSVDTENATKVFFDTDLIFQYDMYQIRYRFIEKKIIRESEQSTDTFHLIHDKPSIFFSDSSPDLVSHCAMICKNGELEIPVSVYKEYPLALQFDIKE